MTRQQVHSPSSGGALIAGYLALLVVGPSPALMACQATIALPKVPLGESESALLLLEGEGRPRAYAFDAASPTSSLRLEPQVVLRLGVYSVPLAELGIVAGEVNLEDSAAPIAPVPTLERTMSDPYTEWSGPQGPSEIWSELKVQRVMDGCLDLEKIGQQTEKFAELAAQGRCWMTTPEFDGTIFGNPLGAWRLDREGIQPLFGGAITATTGPIATASTPLLAGQLGLDGRLYLLQKGGELWRGRGPRSYESLGVVPGSSTASTAWMVTSSATGRVQLYILDAHGGLWRWEESGFTTILEPTDDPPFDLSGGLVWLGQDDVLALGPRNGKVLRVQDLNVNETELPGTTTPTALYETHRSGVLLGDLGGQIYRFRDGSWTPIAGAPRARDVYVILELADGLLYGPQSGLLRYFPEARPECTGELQLERTTFGGVSYERNAVILSSSGIFGDGGPITVTRLTFP